MAENLLTAFYWNENKSPNYFSNNPEEIKNQTFQAKNFLSRGENLDVDGTLKVLASIIKESGNMEYKFYNSLFPQDEEKYKESFLNAVRNNFPQDFGANGAEEYMKTKINCGVVDRTLIEVLTYKMYGLNLETGLAEVNDIKGKNKTQVNLIALIKILSSLTSDDLKKAKTAMPPAEALTASILGSIDKLFSDQKKMRNTQKDRSPEMQLVFDDKDALKKLPEIFKSIVVEKKSADGTFYTRIDGKQILTSINDVMKSYQGREKEAKVLLFKANPISPYANPDEVIFYFPIDERYADLVERIEQIANAFADVYREANICPPSSVIAQGIIEVLTQISQERITTGTIKNIGYIVGRKDTKKKDASGNDVLVPGFESRLRQLVLNILQRGDGNGQYVIQNNTNSDILKGLDNSLLEAGFSSEAIKNGVVPIAAQTFHSYILTFIKNSGSTEKTDAEQAYKSLIPHLNQNFERDYNAEIIAGADDLYSSLYSEVNKLGAALSKVTQWGSVLNSLTELHKDNDLVNTSADLIKKSIKELNLSQDLQSEIFDLIDEISNKQDATPMTIKDFIKKINGKAAGSAANVQGSIGEIFYTVLVRTLLPNVDAEQLGASTGVTKKQAHADIAMYQNNIGYGVQAKIYRTNTVDFYKDTKIDFSTINGLKYMGSKEALDAFRFFLINNSIIEQIGNPEVLPISDYNLFQILLQRLDYFMRYGDGASIIKKEGQDVKNHFYMINFNVFPASVILIYVYQILKEELEQTEKTTMKNNELLDASKINFLSLNQTKVIENYEDKSLDNVSSNLLTNEIAVFKGVSINFSPLGAIYNI